MQAEIRDYLDHLVLDRDRAPNTIDRYRSLLGRFVVFVKGELGKPGVTPADVNRHLVERFVRHGGGGATVHAAAPTRNVRLAVLRGFFGHLLVMEQLERNPTVGVRSARVKPNPPGFVTEAEFDHLCEAVRVNASEHYAVRDEALLKLLLNCGLRISEALSLDRAQVSICRGSSSTAS